jgi:cell division protein FtsB
MKLLDTLLSYVRFPVMSAQDLAEIVQPSGVLTEKAMLKLYRYVSSRNKDGLDFGKFIPFPRFRGLEGVERMQQNKKDISTQTEASDESLAEGALLLGDNDSQLIDLDNSRLLSLVHSPSHSLEGPTDSTDIIPVPGHRKIANIEAYVSVVCKSEQNKRIILFVGCFSMEFDGDDDGYHSVENPVSSLDCWEDVVRNWAGAIQSGGVVKSIYIAEPLALCAYPILYTPLLEEFSINLKLDLPDGFPRFSQTFDLRKYAFFTKHPDRHWKFTELWNMGVPITIKINGVTLFHMNKQQKELIINFTNDFDAEEIMKGVQKGDLLTKITLIKTAIPSRIKGFPASSLQHICFYGVKVFGQYDLGNLVRKCRNLVELACFASDNECLMRGVPLPSIVDLDLDFVSGDKLKRISLYNVALLVKISLQDKPVFHGVTELYLEECQWTRKLAGVIHLVFPNLERFSVTRWDPPTIEEADTEETHGTKKETLPEDLSYEVSARMIMSVLKIKSLKWIRVLGLHGNEGLQAQEVTSRPSKNLKRKTRSSEQSQEELRSILDLLKKSGLREESYNFILEKKRRSETEGSAGEDGESWEGQELNEKESKETDDGSYSDLTDRLEFDRYSLKNAYTDHKTWKNCYF